MIIPFRIALLSLRSAATIIAAQPAQITDAALADVTTVKAKVNAVDLAKRESHGHGSARPHRDAHGRRPGEESRASESGATSSCSSMRKR